jgi:biopolymer transport protein ExbD
MSKKPPPPPEKESAGMLWQPTKRPIYEDLVDMTAMVDIVFFLLIFFMVTSMQGLFAGLEVPAPETRKTTTKVRKTMSDYEKDTECIIVRIDREDAVWLDEAEVPSEQDLREKLRIRRQSGENKLLLLASGDCSHGKVVMVLDSGCDAGIEELQMAIDSEL